MDRRLLSVKDAAAYLGLSPRTIYNRNVKGSKSIDGMTRRFDLDDGWKFVWGKWDDHR